MERFSIPATLSDRKHVTEHCCRGDGCHGDPAAERRHRRLAG